MSALTLYPAIDLKDGACVRLRRGVMDEATIYSDKPASQAQRWQQAGCRWLHVVDLDGAFAGHAVNAEAITAILATVDVPVQLGGGIRDLATIERWLTAGVARVILGSVAVKQPALVHNACRAFPGRIVVGIDANAGRVATEGWAQLSDIAVTDLARRFVDVGVAAIIHTDIARDGMLAGLAVDETVALAEAVSIPVIASGGVGDVDDLHALKLAAAGRIEGVVVGRALYDGRLGITEALAALA